MTLEIDPKDSQQNDSYASTLIEASAWNISCPKLPPILPCSGPTHSCPSHEVSLYHGYFIRHSFKITRRIFMQLHYWQLKIKRMITLARHC